jgi:hypothetical protein
MYLLPLTKTQYKRRREVAMEMWELCLLAYAKLEVDIEQVEESRKFDMDYFKEEIKPLATDLAIIDVFGKQLYDTTGLLTIDLRQLWDRWLRLRNVLGKYLGPEHDGILDIDNKYRSGYWPWFLVPKLPEINFYRRPSIPSPPEDPVKSPVEQLPTSRTRPKLGKKRRSLQCDIDIKYISSKLLQSMS